MDYDFLLVTSWSERDQRMLRLWAEELADRGCDVCLLTPAPLVVSPYEEIDVIVMSEMKAQNPDVEDVEEEFSVPSLSHLVFTERRLFNLSEEEAIERGRSVAGKLENVFESHSFDYGLQIRGPEIHRLLVHYRFLRQRGEHVWVGFSPFEGEISIQTHLDGTWDTYQTIEYEEMTETARTTVRDHVASFRDEQRFYTYDGDDDVSRIRRLLQELTGLLNRRRPGSTLDRIGDRLIRSSKEALNGILFPSITQSRQMCEEFEYLLFPLQYPEESRLTVFSPEYYRQEWLIEYISRILPASKKLFVKSHPNHSGVPDPHRVVALNRKDSVQFLHPSFDAHEAIDESDGVLVTNNTVGFQTIYYRKPLFVVGNAFYSQTPAAIEVDDLSKLPVHIAEHLGREQSEEAMISSLYSLREASFQGDRLRFDAVNISDTIDSVFEFLKR